MKDLLTYLLTYLLVRVALQPKRSRKSITRLSVDDDEELVMVES